MINALPHDKSQPSGSSPAIPSMPSTPASTPVAPPVAMSGMMPATATAPHGKVENLSESLSAKIHAGDPTGTPTGISSPAIPSTQPDKSFDVPSTPPKKPFKFFVSKNLIPALVLALVVAGGGAGYYLSQQDTDNRQEAASEEVTGTETSRSPADWGIFNQQWNAILNDPNKTWIDYVQYSQEPAGARYSCNEPIMTVGEETLYGCDLNALFILYEPDAYIQPAAIGPQDPALNAVLDALITNSGLLQEAEKRQLITLDESIYNSASKDPIKRIDNLRELREAVGHTFDKTVDYEAITIYFHNQVDPKIPLAQAQAAAKAKMDNLYARLQSGEITMEQAGAEIAADNIKGDTTGISLANLDTLYKENAYVVRIEHVFDSRFFKDMTLDEELRSLGEGQMSTVRLCKDYKFTDAEFFASLETGDFSSPLVDSCYVIFKLNKINFGWLDEGADTVSAEDYIKENYTGQTTKQTENFKQ